MTKNAIENNINKVESVKIDYYPNIEKASLFLIGSVIFTFGSVLVFKDFLNYNQNIFKGILIFLGTILFALGGIHSLFLLVRKKPLITLTENELIIFNVIKKEKIIKFKDIKSFFIVNTYNKGFVSSRHIFIEMKKPTEKYSNSWYYKLYKKFGVEIANSEYSIQTTFIDVNHKELSKILNKKLKENVA